MPRSTKNKAKAAETATGPTIKTNVATEAKRAADKAKADKAAAEPNKGFEENQARVTAPSKSGETVTVVCKIPGGLKLRFFRKVERMVDVKGGREKEISHVLDASVKPLIIRGPAHPVGMAPKAMLAGGAALTPGIPKDLWERWVHENSQHPALLNGQLFSEGTRDRAIGRARAEKENMSGMQPMAQGADPRTPRRRNRKGQMTDDPAIEQLEDDAA